MAMQAQPFVVVTGASTGIGFELARCFANDGYDLLIVAGEPEINNAAAQLEQSGARVKASQADLSTQEGVDKLYEVIRGRPVDSQLIPGEVLGKGFLD